MSTLPQVLALLPRTDGAALAWFFVAWVGYAQFARRRVELQPSVLATTHRIRRRWMLQTTKREVRVIDGVVVQNLSARASSPRPGS